MEGQQARIVSKYDLVRAMKETGKRLQFVGTVQYSTGYEYSDPIKSDIFPVGSRGEYAHYQLRSESREKAIEKAITRATEMDGTFVIPKYNNCGRDNDNETGFRDYHFEGKVYKLAERQA